MKRLVACSPPLLSGFGRGNRGAPVESAANVFAAWSH